MMNERIETLARQSRMFANDEIYYLERVHNRDYSTEEWQDICNEKFAELLVRECVSLFNGSKEMKTIGMLSHKQVVDQIEKHFGVEE